jgi:hypothetical protein
MYGIAWCRNVRPSVVVEEEGNEKRKEREGKRRKD